jgi:hypothetical protein
MLLPCSCGRRRQCGPPAGTASRRSRPMVCGCRRTLLSKSPFSLLNLAIPAGA